MAPTHYTRQQFIYNSNTIYHNPSKCQINHLQQIQNSTAPAIFETSKTLSYLSYFSGLKLMKICNTRFYLLNTKHKVLTISRLKYLYIIQPDICSALIQQFSSSDVTINMSLKATHHSFALCITLTINKAPHSLHQP